MTRCDDGEVLQDGIISDRLCGDDCLASTGDGSACTTVLEGDTITVTCEQSWEDLPGCLATNAYSDVYHLDADTISGEGRGTLTYAGTGCPPGLDEQCWDIHYSATRIAGAAVCGVNSATGSGGAVKGRFH